MPAQLIFNVLALAATAWSAAPFLDEGGADVIPDTYIVVFHKTATLTERQQHMNVFSRAEAKSNITHQWSFSDFHGYAAKMSPDMLNKVRADEAVVRYVSHDKMAGIAKAEVVTKMSVKKPKVSDPCVGSCETQVGATWGIVRTTVRESVATKEYLYNTSNLGAGVSVYILDTGVLIDHAEFQGRAEWGTNTADDSDTDGNGHGTHVAGTAAGSIYGIAKKAKIVAVKVLNAEGSGTYAGIIKGMEWTCTDHKAKANKCVSNLSLGGPKSTDINEALAALVDCGCSAAVASGNSGRDACDFSPASSPEAFTVNAMDSSDRETTFSNYGNCTDIFAPGQEITAAYIGSPYSLATLQGTSMASPHVAGVMARIAEAKTAVPHEVYAEIRRIATRNVITNESPNTPDLLLYQPCEAI